MRYDDKLKKHQFVMPVVMMKKTERRNKKIVKQGSHLASANHGGTDILLSFFLNWRWRKTDAPALAANLSDNHQKDIINHYQ